jgi:hypothetical protein
LSGVARAGIAKDENKQDECIAHTDLADGLLVSLKSRIRGIMKSTTSGSVKKVNLGGRPPASWSDGLWIEICRQLYVGELKPSRQSDVTKAMMEWLAAQGHDVSETTVKDRARKLWAAIEREDGN